MVFSDAFAGKSTKFNLKKKRKTNLLTTGHNRWPISPKTPMKQTGGVDGKNH